MHTNTAATLLKALLPPTCPAHLDAVAVESETLQLQLTTTARARAVPCVPCPQTTVHSRYQRHLTDLPWGSLAVRIQLTVRKFVCRNATCVRRIFTERLPALVAVYARNTCRLVAALQAIASPWEEMRAPGSRPACGCRRVRPPCSPGPGGP